MIPKIIHFVWLGNQTKPKKIQECIDSWTRQLPDFKIQEWNEKNWDINSSKFTKECYAAGKFAYVSDVIRLDVLSRFGGIYLDSDVLIKKNLSDLLDNRDLILGFMFDNVLSTAFMGSSPHNPFIEDFLSDYASYTYDDILRKKIPRTNNSLLTRKVVETFSEFRRDNSLQELLDDSIRIYPKEYFEFPTWNHKIDYGEHLFTKSWSFDNKSSMRQLIKRLIATILGNVLYGKIRSARGKRRYVTLDE